MNPYDTGFIGGKRRYSSNPNRAGRVNRDGYDYSITEDAHNRAEIQEVIQGYSSNPSEFSIKLEPDYA